MKQDDTGLIIRRKVMANSRDSALPRFFGDRRVILHAEMTPVHLKSLSHGLVPDLAHYPCRSKTAVPHLPEEVDRIMPVLDLVGKDAVKLRNVIAPENDGNLSFGDIFKCRRDDRRHVQAQQMLDGDGKFLQVIG